MKNAWLIAVLIFGSACALPWTGDPRVALTDWSAPHGATSYIELASRFAPWKRSTLGLSCGSDHQLRLIFRSRLPGPRSSLKQGDEGQATIFVRDIAHKLEVPIRLVEVSVTDTLLSDRLSPPQVKALTAFLASGQSQTVDIMTMETGTFMKARANGSAVQKVVSACT
jgi:hypothetical protein